MKRCIHCRKMRALRWFHRNYGTADRHDGRCKDCAAEYRHRQLAPRKCARRLCLVMFTPKRSSGEFCSRVCANWVTNERRKARRYCPQSREVIAAHFGPAIIPPHKPPMCHGQALSFGSDPHTGTSIQWCHVCGEKPLQRFGVVKYPQRPEFEKELAERYEQVKRKPKKVKTNNTWQNDFKVIGKALKQKIEAA